MHASKKTSSVKKMDADSKFFIIAPVLASLWLTSCITTQGDRSDKLNSAVTASDRGVTDGSTRGRGEARAGSSFNTAGLRYAEGVGQNTRGPDAFGPTNRRVALVIGNSNYGNEIGKLANPKRDAAAIAEALERTGFEVSLLQDVSREEMLRAVLDFDESLRDTDVGLFYYAGHAIQVNGRNFMIPTEAKLDIASTRHDAVADYVALETVDINDVLARMGNAEAKLNIVILDACRNNPFNDGTRGLSRGLAQTTAPRGTFVAYATSPGKVAQDGRAQNSPYTAAIVRNLETPGLKLEDVFKRVRQDVALETNGEQIPWENSSVFGDFYFSDPLPEPEPEPEIAVEPTLEPEPQEEKEFAALPKLQPKVETKDESELSRHDYIEVQRLLTRMGHYQGPITGEDDRGTRDAIILWQKAHGLELDGEISKVQIAFMRTDAVRFDDKAGIETEASDDFERLPPLRPKNARPTRKLQEPEKPIRKWDEMIVPTPPA